MKISFGSEVGSTEEADGAPRMMEGDLIERVNGMVLK